jgi:hypothetical protein
MGYYIDNFVSFEDLCFLEDAFLPGCCRLPLQIEVELKAENRPLQQSFSRFFLDATF